MKKYILKVVCLIMIFVFFLTACPVVSKPDTEKTQYSVEFLTNCSIQPEGTGTIMINEGDVVPRVDEKLFVEATKDLKAGFYFDGWYANPTYTTKWNFSTDTVTKNIKLYAHWLPETETLNYTLVGSEYRLDGPSASIAYTEGRLVIPAYRDDGSGNIYPVTEIAGNSSAADDDGFQNTLDITEVYIPSTIKIMGGYIFSGCSQLLAVNIRATVPPAAGIQTIYPGASLVIVRIPYLSLNQYEQAAEWENYKYLNLFKQSD